MPKLRKDWAAAQNAMEQSEIKLLNVAESALDPGTGVDVWIEELVVAAQKYAQDVATYQQLGGDGMAYEAPPQGESLIIPIVISAEQAAQFAKRIGVLAKKKLDALSDPDCDTGANPT